jgi:hypothetical protein
MVAVSNERYDGIYHNEVQISHRDIRNPLVVETIPDDQRELQPIDKIVGSGYLRAPREKPFAVARSRLRKGFRGEMCGIAVSQKIVDACARSSATASVERDIIDFWNYKYKPLCFIEPRAAREYRNDVAPIICDEIIFRDPVFRLPEPEVSFAIAFLMNMSCVLLPVFTAVNRLKLLQK